MTENQQVVLEAARKLRAKNSKRFTRLYWEYCLDGYTSPDNFRKIVKKANDNVIALKPKVSPSMQFDKYLHICEYQILGKEA